MLSQKTITDVQSTCKDWITSGQSIGFVPTMGALHEGHLSLVQASLAQADRTVVSIFVNPLQFGANEDLDNYPRPIEHDLALLKELGVDLVWLPESDELYPQNFKTYVDVPDLGQNLCGVARPGHFRGVATVVCKLLNVVRPTWAYFGEKDFQQLRIIETMVNDLHMGVNVVSCPTIREPSGLAMSSRNRYLTDKERLDAARVYQALQLCQEQILKGHRDVEELKQIVQERLLSVDGLSIDYLDVIDYNTFLSVQSLEAPVIVAVAVFLGQARLIDHIKVDI